MIVQKNKTQWNKLLERFASGWFGAAWYCRDIGISDSSFKRLVHQYRKAQGENFILSRWCDNKVFEGRHMIYWLNNYFPDAIAVARSMITKNEGEETHV